MRNIFLALLLTALPACAAAQQTSQPAQAERQDGLDQRGDHVMGFSHDATTHHFRLLKDGGEIIVVANDPNDKPSIEQIRAHLYHLVGTFSNGDFNAPMLIHDTNPPGVATMTRLKSEIRYTVSEIDRGAKIRILTSSPETTDAVHAFLLFQIIDHKTGDSPAISD
jgi:TusA-related sulfurtransferase